MCNSPALTPTRSSSFTLLHFHNLNRRPIFSSDHRLRDLYYNHNPFPFLSPRNRRFPIFRSSSSSSSSSSNVSCDYSWSSIDDSSVDSFAGWYSPNFPISNKKSGYPKLLVTGFGALIAVLLGVVAHFSFNGNGFRLPFKVSFPGLSTPLVVESTENYDAGSNAPDHQECEISESVQVESSDVVTESATLDFSEEHKPRIITGSVDLSQQEAVNVLKKLKIIDEDVKANEICSRREYARWLVRASSLLERNPKYKIASAVTLSGSVITAYEDVTVEDQDFEAIQALAETGIVLSKLSTNNNLDVGGRKFSPERFISRGDLIDWRAQLEYDFSRIRNQEMLKTKLDLLDVREISFENWPGLLMDMLAGERCLLWRVFGHIRRLQPDKPSTVAQAAVALISGRMTAAMDTELQRMQAEESSRQAAKEEIKLELLGRGEIQRHWDDKIEEEKVHAMEMQHSYTDALETLEQEKSALESARNDYLKEKAAMECQKQLLECLKEEVNSMSEKLVSERAEQIAEEEAAQTLHSDLQTRKEGLLDAKSLLEAEIEALRILRSWIEDEARKSGARLKVLEEVGRRWKWDGE